MKKSEFNLAEKMQALEAIERYFEQPEIDFAEGLTQHKQALKLEQEILHYLDTVENELLELDATAGEIPEE